MRYPLDFRISFGDLKTQKTFIQNVVKTKRQCSVGI